MQSSNKIVYKNDPIISKLEITPFEASNRCITTLNLPNNTDLIPGKYEGGLKIWECSLDLVDFLPTVFSNFSNFENLKVMDLGCGHGFAGLYFVLRGSKCVVFQDFNQEVLDITKGYINQIKEKYNVDLINNCFFCSGDWAQFTFNSTFDVIISGDTLYNEDNYEKIYNVLNQYLSENGVAYFATKKFYYGVGGGMSSFCYFIRNKGQFEISKVKESDSGISNIRAILELKRIKNK